MDDVTIANRAVARIGGIKIQSFDAPGPSGHIVPETYTSVLEDMLGKYPWHFTKKTRAPLFRTAETPNRWTYRFRLPPDRLAPPRAVHDSATARLPFHQWEPEGDGILSNAENLWCDYQWRPPVVWWPTYFRELIILAVAAELAGALREDWSLRAKLRTETYGSEQYQGEGGQFAVCTSLDAQAQPSPEIDGGRNPMTASRFTTGDARAGFEDW
jgi:hypothetical protein